MADGKREHHYAVAVEWTGNRGSGTSDYRAYGRDHRIEAGGKTGIAGSADAAFRGDSGRWNPEELLVPALAACHRLTYLHLCATAGIHVLAYRDDASGAMAEHPLTGGGQFVSVMLRPEVTIRATDDPDLARRLHKDAGDKCYIANSVRFAVRHEPVIRQEP